MPWYKLEADHGPGHQSRTVKYVWRDEPMSMTEERDAFEDAFDDLNWPIGEVVKLGRLPKEVHPEMVERYERQGREASRMLKILVDTPIEENWECQWCHLPKIKSQWSRDQFCVACSEQIKLKPETHPRRFCRDCCSKHGICCSCRFSYNLDESGRPKLPKSSTGVPR